MTKDVIILRGWRRNFSPRTAQKKLNQTCKGRSWPESNPEPLKWKFSPQLDAVMEWFFHLLEKAWNGGVSKAAVVVLGLGEEENASNC